MWVFVKILLLTGGDLEYDFCKGRQTMSVLQVIKRRYRKAVIALLPTDVDVARSLVVSSTSTYHSDDKPF